MIYFYNNTDAPLEALFTLGVSVKSEGSIGYFGTGFKFALATLLRTGHKVWLNDRPFGLRRATIRGEPFNIITFEGRDLGFTDQLGRTWEVWQAFRELHANALDEGGTSTRHRPSAQTVIAVQGEGIEKAFDERHLIFIEAPVIAQDEDIKIHAGNSTHIYYRGVRAGDTPLLPALNTYNLLRSVRLTDDRTIASSWIVENCAARLIAASDDEDLISEAVLAGETYWECRFDYSNANPSETFMRVLRSLRTNARVNQSALNLYLEHSGEKDRPPETITLTPDEERVLEQALALCKRLGCDPGKMYFVESLGSDVYGMCRKGDIYIARTVFDQGYRRLASTIYEEWLHKVHHFADCSRSMQNYLFDKLLAVVDSDYAK